MGAAGASANVNFIHRTVPPVVCSYISEPEEVSQVGRKLTSQVRQLPSPASSRPVLESVFAILGSTPEKLRREVRDTPLWDLKKWPAPGKWSIEEILAHLADVEQVGMRERVEAIITEDRPVLEPFDQEKRAVELHYNRIDPKASLASLTSQRSANVKWLQKLRPAQLRRVGIHQSVGEVSVLDFLHEWAFHDLGHLKQILKVKRYGLFPKMGNTQKFYQFGQ
jgi:DinB superfamily